MFHHIALLSRCPKSHQSIVIQKCSIKSVVVGLAGFGVVFAMNSSIHSYMVLAYTDAESVSLNMGFYYMASAAGRLMGTLLSGALFLSGGIQACLWMSSVLIGLAFAVSTQLPRPGSAASTLP